MPLMYLANTAPMLTREVFGNIPPAGKAIFYLLSIASIACFAWGVHRRARLWRIGRKTDERSDIRQALWRFIVRILVQRAVLGRGAASVAHVLLFAGFVVLLIGTTLIAIEHWLADLMGRAPGEPVFHKGVYYAIYEATLDAFGLAFLAGCAWFWLRRLRGGTSIGRHWTDHAVLGGLLVIGVTGYLVEGLRIIREATYLPGFSFVGLVTARGFEAMGVDQAGASGIHFALWWFHAIAALGLIAAFPYTRLLHALAGVVNVTLHEKKLGAMTAIALEEVEETGRVGVSELEHFTRRQLLELDACVSCGRCQDACPAYEAGKPLSPRDVVQDLRAQMNAVGTGSASLHGEVIGAETLWSCTTCSACVEVCPLGVRPMELITDMRRHLIAEGSLRGSPAQALAKAQRSGNPWGLPAKERLAWAEGLDVPTVETNPDFEVLYWVGCAAAYDRRARKTARSVVRLLQAANVNFAVLGNYERCTGESARRMGDEFVFQELAQANIETLAAHKVTKILTHCPHCMNSLRQDYPQFGGTYEVIHHTQFLALLIKDGRLKVERGLASEREMKLTLHDPCYLARVQGETAAPRTLVQLTVSAGGGGDDTSGFIELPRHGRETSCCGAGGGRMWFDDGPDQRVGRSRAQEIVSSGADGVAVACPFCLVMVGDAVAATDQDLPVRDIAQWLAEAAGVGE